MSEIKTDSNRVVAWTPTKRDAQLCGDILTQNDIDVCCCETLDALLHAIDEGAGIALVAQEHLGDEAIARLIQMQRQQPKWSEMPILVLLQPGDIGSATLQRILSLEHVTLIHRPLRIAVFVNTVLAKLRDRRRQFEVRDLLAEQTESQTELRQSHETFRRLIEDNPQGLYVIDHEMRMLYWSRGAQEVFEHLEPLQGRPFEELMHGIWPTEFAEQAISLFRNTLETGEPYTAPTLVEQRVDIEATEAYDWQIKRMVLPGNRYGVVCHFYDATQRQESLDLLRRSEQYFRQIADASPAMLWVTDENHQCTFLSEAWYATTGQTEEEGMGLGWTDATHPDDQEQAGKEFLDAAKAHEPLSSEYRLRQRDGSYRWAADFGRPRFDNHGNFLGYTGYVIDVDSRRKSEESLRTAKAIAESANRSRGEFLANMSHEIRTPMAAIIGHADILKDHLQDPDNMQVVDTIRRNGQFLLGIINDILDLSKIDAGKMEIDSHPIRPDAVVAEVRSLMDVRASEKKLPLKIEFDGPVPETIRTDAVRLRQVLLNLVGNAIKFTDEGEVKLQVSYRPPPRSGTRQSSDSNAADIGSLATSATDDAASLVFQIIDSGIGIAADKLDTLFDPFVQADNTSTRSFGGTGLGLTICKRLALALGGDVTVESTPNRGSTFTLTIAANSPGRLVDPNLSVDIAAEPVDQDIRLNAKILVVDDRRDIRYLAQHFIEKAGGEVFTATNGQEAVDFIESSESPQVDLIVMDMQMPILDGYEATTLLRKKGYKLPIIALTANAMKSDRDECLVAGCSDYTTKPLDKRILVAMIDRLARVDR